MGLGIACAATGSKAIIGLLDTALVDKEPWVRQGAYIALGLLLNQRPVTEEEETRKRMMEVVIPKRGEPSVSKVGSGLMSIQLIIHLSLVRGDHIDGSHECGDAQCLLLSVQSQ